MIRSIEGSRLGLIALKCRIWLLLLAEKPGILNLFVQF